MTEDLQLHPSIIQRKIYSIRSQRVMIDRDLADMYGVETRALNQAVKRNIERFPEDFMFQLSESEWQSMSSQFVMTSKSKRPISALPYAFTEHGVTMLSGVLRSTIAIKVNIQLVRAFIAIRQLALNYPNDKVSELQSELNQLKAYIEEVLMDYNDINEDTRMQMELINQSLAELHTEQKIITKPRKKIGFITEN
ncbi:MAG: ORF6N domain-containing protein [Bacteroidales bacterium]